MKTAGNRSIHEEVRERRSRIADMKKKTEMTVLDSRMLAPEIWSMELAYTPEDAPDDVKPGQFCGLYPQGGDMLLMRPISICGWDPARRALRFVYRVAGRGTRSFTTLRQGDRLQMLGILGNGYDMDLLAGRHVLLLGGGIGIPPMLGLAQALRSTAERGADTKVTAVLGYRDRALFLKEEMEACADAVCVATEDGSIGTKGNVLDAVREQGIRADVICACGPLPMLRAVKQYADREKIPAFLSLEERMACGVGVCLGCVAKTTKKDEHSQVNNARVCVEGPVFAAEDVEL